MKQITIDLRLKVQAIEIYEDTEILGVFLGRADDKVDLDLQIVHTRPNLKSYTLFKAVLFDHSQLNFRGTLIIKQGAKFTDTYLKASVLMMSPTAVAKAIPALEIMEDEVKGGHGATISKIDPEELFYLQSRGLNKQESETIIVDAFLAEVTNRLNTNNDGR